MEATPNAVPEQDRPERMPLAPAAPVSAPEIKVPQELKDLGAQVKKGFLKAFGQGVAALDKATSGTQARAKGEQILRGARRPGAWKELLNPSGATGPLPIKEMKGRVEASMNDEKESGRLRARVAAFVEAKGMDASAAPVAAEVLHGALMEYVRRAPLLIELAAANAAAQGQGAKMLPLLHMASKLFLAKDDLIPESEGLYGLIDNAYLALGVLAAASSEHARRSGKPLFDLDLSTANEAVRELLGAEQAAALDGRISEIKDLAAFKQAVTVALWTAGAAVAALVVGAALTSGGGGTGQLIARQATRRLGGGGGVGAATGGAGSWGPCVEDEIARLSAQIGLST